VDLSQYPYKLPSDFGPYRLESRLGEGGMGAVFLGIELESSALGVRVESAIKIPDAKLLRNDPTMAAQFVREAHAASRVRHPAVVKLEKVGMVGDIPYIAMDLLYGEGLEKTLERGPMPPAEVVAAGIAICGGLDAVHKAGLIHRDLKPSNVFRTTHGEFKLLDLGIAKAMDAATRMTGTGMSKGTPGYMAPEQLEDGKSLDERTDLFALGAVLAELALGEPVFVGETLMSLLMVMSKAEAHVADSSVGQRVNLVCPGLGNIVVDCLRQSPGDRPNSAAEVHSALSDLAIDTPTARLSSSIVAPEEPAPRKTRPKPEQAPPDSSVSSQPKRPPPATRPLATEKPSAATRQKTRPVPAQSPTAKSAQDAPPKVTRAVQNTTSRPTPVAKPSEDEEQPRNRSSTTTIVAAGSGGLLALGIGVSSALFAITLLVCGYKFLLMKGPTDLEINIDPIAEEVLVDGESVGSGARIVTKNPIGARTLEVRHPRFRPIVRELEKSEWESGKVDVTLELLEPLDFRPDGTMVRGLVPQEKAAEVFGARADAFDRCIKPTVEKGQILTGTVRVHVGGRGQAIGMAAEGKNTDRADVLDCLARQAAVIEMGPLKQGDFATLRYDYSVAFDGENQPSPALVLQEPIPPPAAAPTRKPDPSPASLQISAPAPLAESGTVSVRGSVPVQLRGKSAIFLPGNGIPPGSYEVWANFGEGMTHATMDLAVVKVGEEINIKCSSLRQDCSIQ